MFDSVSYTSCHTLKWALTRDAWHRKGLKETAHSASKESEDLIGHAWLKKEAIHHRNQRYLRRYYITTDKCSEGTLTLQMSGTTCTDNHLRHTRASH